MNNCELNCIREEKKLEIKNIKVMLRQRWMNEFNVIIINLWVSIRINNKKKQQQRVV